MKIGVVLCAVVFATAAGQGMAQTTPQSAPIATPPNPPSAVPPATAVPPVRGVAAMTPVEIEVAAPLNSKTSRIGETFPIRLLSPVLDGSGRIVLPSGTRGQGEVIHAAKARGMGKAGEMILAARYLQCGDTRIPLGHFKFAVRGKDNSTNAAVAMAVAGPFLAFMSGGEVNVPNGAHADAKITADVAIPESVTAQCGGTPPATIIPTAEKGSQ